MNMALSDWRKLVLSEGDLPEPIMDCNRIDFWLRGDCKRGEACWERIASVAGAETSKAIANLQRMRASHQFEKNRSL
jgi:hypothetical protein